MQDQTLPWFVRIRFQFGDCAETTNFGPFHDRCELAGFISGIQMNPEILIDTVDQREPATYMVPPASASFIVDSYDDLFDDDDDDLVVDVNEDDPRFRPMVAMGIL